MNKKIYPVLGCLTAIGMVLASPSFAATQVADAPQASNKLEEIIVTAQKRKENLQSVPISVTAVGAVALKNAGITNAGELPTLVSGLVFQQNASNFNVYLRGIGNPSSTVGDESSVAVYIDGVYFARLAPVLLDLNNIQQVEVLKGPQGTLFGRNADGGLIQIITKDPSQTPTLHVDVGYGNYDTFTGNLYASTGIGSKIAADIAVHDVTMSGGFGTNLYNGQPFGWEDDLGVRSKWVVRPSDDTKITLTFDYSKSVTTEGGIYGGNQVKGTTHGLHCGVSCDPFVPPAPNQPALPELGFYDEDVNGNNSGKDLGLGGSVKVEHDFSFAKLVSISALRKMTGSYNADADYTTQNYFQFNGGYWQQQVTQELQLISQKGSPFDWQVGAFYMNLESQYDDVRFSGEQWEDAFGPGGEFDPYASETVQSYAGYAQGTFHILDHTDITGGLRYTEDQIRGSGHNDIVDHAFGVDVNTGFLQNSKNYEKLTYRMALDHHFSDDVMGYVSYNRGFKAGTYNMLTFNPVPVAPEILDAYELGLKTELLDHHLRLNATFFYDQARNLQVQSFIYSSGLETIALTNAAAAESKGLDLDAQAIFNDRLTGHLSATLLDADYTSYPGAGQSINNAVGPGTTLNPVPFNATGQALPYSPTLSMTFGLNYRLPTAIGEWQLAANYSWNSGYSFAADQEVNNGPFGLLDARATYTLPSNDHWHFSLWGKNLTGEEYYQGIVEEESLNGTIYSPGAPRTFGFTVSYDM